MKITHGIALLAAPLFLLACGGGGDGTSSGTYDLERALASWNQSAQSVALRGSGSCTGALVHTQQAGNPAASFEAQPARATEVTQTAFLAPGCPIASGVFRHTQFLGTQAEVVGLSGSSVTAPQAAYLVYQAKASPLPSAKIGDSGVLAKATVYADSSKQQVVAQEEQTYRLEAGEGRSARLLVTSRRTDASGAASHEEERHYALSAEHSLTLQAMRIQGQWFAQ